MKSIGTKTLGMFQNEIELLNNYFRSDYFINVVDESGMAKKFKRAEYDTIRKCRNYINLWFSVFGDIVENDGDFWTLYKKTYVTYVCKDQENIIMKELAWYKRFE